MVIFGNISRKNLIKLNKHNKNFLGGNHIISYHISYTPEPLCHAQL